MSDILIKNISAPLWDFRYIFSFINYSLSFLLFAGIEVHQKLAPEFGYDKNLGCVSNGGDTLLSNVVRWLLLVSVTKEV